MVPRSRRAIVTIAVILAVVALASRAFLAKESTATKYRTEAASRGALVAEVTATGTVNPVTNVQVGTYVSGPIQAIYADFNSRVTKGQLVAKIDPAPYQVKVKSSEAAVANAKARVLKDQADLAFKKLSYQRSGKLLEKSFISQNDLDTAKSNYDQAVAQLALD